MENSSLGIEFTVAQPVEQEEDMPTEQETTIPKYDVEIPEDVLEHDPESDSMQLYLNQYREVLDGVSENLYAPEDKTDVIAHVYEHFDTPHNRIIRREKLLADWAERYNAVVEKRNRINDETYRYYLAEYKAGGSANEPFKLKTIPTLPDYERKTQDMPTIMLGDSEYAMTTLSVVKNNAQLTDEQMAENGSNSTAEYALVRLQKLDVVQEDDALRVLLIPLKEASVDQMNNGGWERFAYTGTPATQTDTELGAMPAYEFSRINDNEIDSDATNTVKFILHQAASSNQSNYVSISGEDSNGYTDMSLETIPAMYTSYLAQRASKDYQTQAA